MALYDPQEELGASLRETGSRPSGQAPTGLVAPRIDPAHTADFTLAELLAWARTKPAADAYEYTKSRDCALCQFLNETGRTEVAAVVPDGWYDAAKGRDFRDLDEAMDDAANARPWSFGAFADRLEASLSRSGVGV